MMSCYFKSFQWSDDGMAIVVPCPNRPKFVFINLKAGYTTYSYGSLCCCDSHSKGFDAGWTYERKVCVYKYRDEQKAKI